MITLLYILTCVWVLGAVWINTWLWPTRPSYANVLASTPAFFQIPWCRPFHHPLHGTDNKDNQQAHQIWLKCFDAHTTSQLFSLTSKCQKPSEIWKKCLDFKWSGLWMVGIIGIAKALPFEKWTIWKPTFKKSGFQMFQGFKWFDFRSPLYLQPNPVFETGFNQSFLVCRVDFNDDYFNDQTLAKKRLLRQHVDKLPRHIFDGSMIFSLQRLFPVS